ncbi:c-type cytochrome [Rhodovulum steppense]|uniref:Cytochrome c2 n=1 Tax=Rhodovulum steppense TaxID=540251 RepID=A0A4R1YXZ0_9RHOB|nr:cytochrome c [Rhodovulum steppense]TCM86099.1 cytochrome c2 [Rhodovulum steppense]
MRRWWIAGMGAVALVALAAVSMVPFGQTPAPVEPRAMVQVALPGLSDMAQVGQAAFGRNCAECHGPDAGGRLGLGPPLIHRVYEPSHHGDIAFWMAVRRGVVAHHWPFGDMPSVPGVRDDEIAAIIAFVREVQRANGIH